MERQWLEKEINEHVLMVIYLLSRDAIEYYVNGILVFVDSPSILCLKSRVRNRSQFAGRNIRSEKEDAPKMRYIRKIREVYWLRYSSLETFEEIPLVLERVRKITFMQLLNSLWKRTTYRKCTFWHHFTL